MRAYGRPVLGAIAGLFLGLFVAIDLQQFGVKTLDNVSVFGFPAIGLVLGLVLAWWGPFGRGRAEMRARASTGHDHPAPSEPDVEPGPPDRPPV